MTYGLKQTVAPPEHPLSLDAAKTHLRVSFDDEDDNITAMIAAAVDDFQEATFRQLVTATYRMRLDDFGAEDFLVLPRAPLQSVASVKYVDTAGVEQTLVDGTDYVVETDREPGRIRLATFARSWPTTFEGPNAVRIVFDAGYGAAAAAPPLIVQALKLMVGARWEFREEIAERRSYPIATGAAAIIQRYELGDELTRYGGRQSMR